MEFYLNIIKQAVFFFPAIAFLFTLPYFAYNYYKYGSVFSLRILIVYSMILYLICAYFLVILPLPAREQVAALTGPRIQPIPFNFIRDIMKESSFHLARPGSYLSLIVNKALFQVLFNVAMTMPFGIYLRYYFCFPLKKTVLYSFLLSLFFELTQLSGLYFYYPRSYRLFDVDDLMANTLGGMLGYFCGKPFLGILPSRAEIDADSLHRGQEISLTRRLTALFLDLLCAGLCSAIGNFVLPGGHLPALYNPLLLFAAYFMFLPIFLRGMTPGKKITKMKVVATDGKNACWYQYILRYGSVLAVFFLFPILWFFWMLYAGIMMAQHKRLFYERLSGTKIISTIPRYSSHPRQVS